MMTKMEKYYFGVDIGGTFIKCGIVDKSGKIIVSDKIPTRYNLGADVMIKDIADFIDLLIKKAKLNKSDIEGVGVGIPGMVDTETGKVLTAENISWKEVDFSNKLKKLTGLKVNIENDANLAALGEYYFGSGKKYNDFVMITLGTGIGAGIIINGKIYAGVKSTGGEVGHMVIKQNGRKCACGRKGCYERYASSISLVKDTVSMMKKHKDSKMWQEGSLEKVDGRTPFKYKDTDIYAKEVLDNYFNYLTIGLVNIANILWPQAIVIGGGISAQGESFRKEIEQRFHKELYNRDVGPKINIELAKLGNDAGLLGAAALNM